MFTLLLRKDLAEAAELVNDLRRHRYLLADRLEDVGDEVGKFLGTPSGLGLCFAAGCATGWMLRHHPPKFQQVRRLADQALPWLALARQFV